MGAHGVWVRADVNDDNDDSQTAVAKVEPERKSFFSSSLCIISLLFVVVVAFVVVIDINVVAVQLFLLQFYFVHSHTPFLRETVYNSYIFIPSHFLSAMLC